MQLWINVTGRWVLIGTIIRDYQGEVFASLSSSNDYITDPVIGKATAAWRATIFCSELGHQRVELEGDVLQVV
jgi:hypothetical protein